MPLGGLIFFQHHLGGVPLNTKMAHPGTSIPKKWGVAPQNHLFQLGSNKRLSTFMGGLIFRSCCHIVQKHAKLSKATFGYFWGIAGGGSQGTLRLRWHIQAHPVRKRWKLLLKLPFSHRRHYYMDHVWVIGFFSSLSIAKKWTAEPQNRLFHIGTSKGWNFFGWPDIFSTPPVGSCHRTLRWHIQARRFRKNEA